ncbi:MAG: hypothetical protein P4L50_05490 [Anaerolineaceae bacterium]|nr:hypothetical protein [Anaerolineaceae bacterium]
MINIIQNRIYSFKLVGNKLEIITDFMFGLCWRKSALRSQFFGGSVEPIAIVLPELYLIDNITPVTGYMI